MNSNLIKQYDAKLDNKKRLTIRGADYEHYKVLIFEEGTVVLKPQVLIELESISDNTLKSIQKSLKSLKKGQASKPVDLSEFDFDKLK